MVNSPSAVIAIVGGGFSGAIVAAHLLHQASQPTTIYLIERKHPIGCGVAYSTGLDCHLLNVPAGKMSVFAHDPDHFVRWLRRHLDLSEPSDRLDRSKRLEPLDTSHLSPLQAPLQAEMSNLEIGSLFVSRRLYGQYIQSVLAQAMTQAAPGVRLEQIIDDAIAITSTGRQLRLNFKGGRILIADRVVLATGNLPPTNNWLPDPAFQQSQHYCASAWSTDRLSKLPSEAPVLLVGSGLTAIDVILALQQQGHTGKIFVTSRHGLLPHSHQTVQPYQGNFDLARCPRSARSLLRWLREEIKQATANGQNWRSVVDALRPDSQLIWQRLPVAEQRRFLRHIRPYWDIHRHRIPSPVAQILKVLQQTEQLQLYAGRVQSIHEDKSGVTVILRQRQTHHLISLHPQLIINCTGSPDRYNRLQDPLITSLLHTDLVRLDPLSLGLETTATGALIGKNGSPSDLLYTLGSVRKGQLWETTAIPELRVQAQQVAEALIQTITIPKQPALTALR